jgi:hypothetical protein
MLRAAYPFLMVIARKMLSAALVKFAFNSNAITAGQRARFSLYIDRITQVVSLSPRESRAESGSMVAESSRIFMESSFAGGPTVGYLDFIPTGKLAERNVSSWATAG